MKKILSLVLAGAALAAASGAATAGDVRFSISIGVPAPRVYAAPVVVAPAPVYYPRRVFYAPAPWAFRHDRGHHRGHDRRW